MKPAYCLIISITVPLLGMLIFFASVFGLSGLGDGQGEDPGQLASSSKGAADAGLTSSEIPSILADLFAQASRETNTTTPVALLAAISNQECGRLWQYTKDNAEEIKTIINDGTDVAHVPNGLDLNQRQKHPNAWGCGYDNGSKVWGPMQFLDTTFGIPSGADAKLHPIPSQNGYGAKASRFTNKAPATAGRPTVSMLSIKDSVYAASIMLYDNADKPASWNEAAVRKTAARYYGSCKGVHAFYCDSIVKKWRNFSPEGNIE